MKGQPLRHCLGDLEGVALDDTPRDVKAEVLNDTVRDRLAEMYAPTLVNTLIDVQCKALVDTIADRLIQAKRLTLQQCWPFRGKTMVDTDLQGKVSAETLCDTLTYMEYEAASDKLAHMLSAAEAQ